MAHVRCHVALANAIAALAGAGAMPHSFPFALVGFDLDGTLLDTSGDLAAAVNHALAGAGRAPLPVERVRTMIGGGSRHMLAQGFDATGGCDTETLDRAQERLLAYYEAHIAVETRPFPSCVAALDALRDRGVAVAVVTNKIERLATRLLGELGLADRFETIIGGDTLGPGRGKPNPDLLQLMVERCGAPGPAAFVGDSTYDVRAAHAAGMKVVACGFGFLSAPVETLGADAIIAGFDELIPTLEMIGS